MRSLVFASAALLSALLVSSSQAAVVTFDLLVDAGGTFELYASSSLGDNFGIASYGAPLTGGVTSVDHASPNAFGSGTLGNQSVAFGLLTLNDAPMRSSTKSISDPAISGNDTSSIRTVAPSFSMT